MPQITERGSDVYYIAKGLSWFALMAGILTSCAILSDFYNGYFPQYISGIGLAALIILVSQFAGAWAFNDLAKGHKKK